MDHRTAHYRGGLLAALQIFEAKRQHELEQVKALGPSARRVLPPQRWAALGDRVRQLQAINPSSLEDLAQAEAMVVACEREVAHCASLLAQFRAARPELRRRRRRVGLRIAALSAGLVVFSSAALAGLARWKRAADLEGWPAKTAACRASGACTYWGRCTAKLGSFSLVGDTASCVAATSEDCKLSERCHRSGACTAVNGGCAVGGDADCQQSVGCTGYGACTAMDRTCVVTTEACRSTPLCRAAGRCTADSDLPVCFDEHACWKLGEARCKAMTASDCEQSVACARAGRCAAVEGVCRAESTPICEALPACAYRGQCTGLGGRCTATDADCLRFPGCKALGRCESVDGRCVSPGDRACKAAPGCDLYGRCAWDGTRCIADDDRDCKQSARCARGECWARGGRCVELSGEDPVATSPACWEFGHCSEPLGWLWQ